MNWRTLLILVTVSLMLGLSGTAFAQTSYVEHIDCQVTIEPTTGTLAIEIIGSQTWNLGSVPQGGVRDTWYDDGVHGSFTVKNAGDTNAYIFVATEGGGIPPTTSLPTAGNYAMAVATNIADALPSWQMLDNSYSYSRTGRLLNRALPGEYILFDLRYYAPESVSGMDMFRVSLYAVAEMDPIDLPPPSGP
jgi:hypothetical protein